MEQSERNRNLGAALKMTLSPRELKQFHAYTLSASDMDLIKETCLEVLERTPVKSFHCAAMSALLGAMLQDHSEIPVAVISGHLFWRGRPVFYCKTPVPEKDCNQVWDGHCWLEFGGLVADISLLRTLRVESKLASMNDFLSEHIGQGKGLLCASPQSLWSLDLEYIPCHSLSELQINGLLKGNYSLDS